MYTVISTQYQTDRQTDRLKVKSQMNIKMLLISILEFVYTEHYNL